MERFKEDRKRMVLGITDYVAIGPFNIGFVRVLMHKEYMMAGSGFQPFKKDTRKSMPVKVTTVTPIKNAAEKFIAEREPQ